MFKIIDKSLSKIWTDMVYRLEQLQTIHQYVSVKILMRVCLYRNEIFCTIPYMSFIVFFYYVCTFTYMLMSHSMTLLYVHLPYFHVSNRALLFAKNSDTLLLHRFSIEIQGNQELVVYLKFYIYSRCYPFKCYFYTTRNHHEFNQIDSSVLRYHLKRMYLR